MAVPMSEADPRPPAAAFHVPPEKLTWYLLDLAHPKGGAGKARFFRAFGFMPEGWKQFAEALRAHGAGRTLAEVEAVAVPALEPPTQTWVVECALTTPDGRNPCVRSVWRLQGGQPPRLVTAYPH